jgi:hypothetical protein
MGLKLWRSGDYQCQPTPPGPSIPRPFSPTSPKFARLQEQGIQTSRKKSKFLPIIHVTGLVVKGFMHEIG